MKRESILLILILVFLPSFVCSQVPEWHSELVLKIPFGDGEGEFAADRHSRSIENFIAEAQSFVWDYYVDSKRVYITDAYRREVKIYELDNGKFVKAIPLLRPEGDRRVPGERLWGAEDMVVLGDTLYILLSLSSIQPDNLSCYSIYTYDIVSGNPITRCRIYNRWLGTDPDFKKYPVRMMGLTWLSTGSNGDLYVYDRARHRSIRIFSRGRPTAKEEHKVGIAGRVCGDRRYYWRGEEGKTLVLSGMSGENVCEAIQLSWSEISPNGEYLLCYSSESNSSERGSVFYVYRYDGKSIGKVIFNYRNGRKSIGVPYGHGNLFISNEGSVYRYNVYDDGVYLYRWLR